MILPLWLSVFWLHAATAADLATPPGKSPEAGANGGVVPVQSKKPGFHTGEVRIRPSLTLGISYDDNVYTTPSDAVSDRIVQISPQVKIDSTWSQHSLRIKAGADAGLYDRLNDENYLDRWAKIDGRIDASETTRFFAGLGYEFGHEERDSPDSKSGGLEPTTFRSLNANVGTRIGSGDTRYQLGVTYETLDYDNVPTRNGVITNTDRDRTLLGLGLRATHRLSDANELFAQALADRRSYDLARDQFGYRRDSSGYRLAAGIKTNFGDKNEAEVYLGLLRQSYDDSRFSRVTKPDFGGRLSYLPDGKTKISLDLQRSVNETTEVGSAGYLKSSLSASLERRYFGRLTPYLNAGYSESDYFAADRKDKDFSVSAGMKFFLTRNTYLSAVISHTERDSNNASGPAVSNDFEKNLVYLGVTSQLYPLN